MSGNVGGHCAGRIAVAGYVSWVSNDEFYAYYAADFPDISTDRLQFLSDIANSTWVDSLTGGDQEFEALAHVWRQREIEFVTTCTSPRELFLFVEMYNWEKGLDLLKAIAVNPVCDVSTARAMFWAASPLYHQKFATRDEVPAYNRDDWDFVMGVLNRLTAGVYQPAASPFDPREWDADDANRAGSKWQIPADLCQLIVV